MAHHQHHGLPHTTSGIQSVDVQQISTASSHQPEDEHAPEADEPPDERGQAFRKTSVQSVQSDIRKQSLLTRALHTDSESHDDADRVPTGFQTFMRQTSRSSTCSNYSQRSEFTSDEGLTSSGTRSSTPNSPPRPIQFSKPDYMTFRPASQTPKANSNLSERSQSPKNHSLSAAPEPSVEAELGRKRCITFSCGSQNTASSTQTTPEPTQLKPQAEPSKRPCMIKFVCPSKMFSKAPDSENKPRASRHLSPPPPDHRKYLSTTPSDKRSHRDSDTTIKYESPKSTRKAESVDHSKQSEDLPDVVRSEATRFHEFASSDEEVEDWTQESTCHKSRLTVDDTLKKEKVIQQLGEEAEKEAIEEEDDMLDDDLNDDDLFDEDVSDGGFQTDDEEGFAESDDSDEGDSDYEWWAPRRPSPPMTATMLPNETVRPHVARSGSDSSVNSALSRLPRPGRSPAVFARRRSAAIPIRPTTPDLPDSTDFVCGTLDEDRPLEMAYASCIEQRKAAKHRKTPQDIDPTFPTSDPDIDTDEEDDDDVEQKTGSLADHNVNFQKEEEPRGRRPTKVSMRSPHPSPKRLKSPAPMMKKGPAVHHSPPPSRGLFGHSTRRLGTPNTIVRLTSPPPSRHTSPSGGRPIPIVAQHFLAQRPQLTHTTSLPRSPNPFVRRPSPYREESSLSQAIESTDNDGEDDDAVEKSDADDNNPNTAYTRGAIDIVQGLERKRLRRRQKFMEKYHKMGNKKRERGEGKRPQPGKGAERMRQVGIECAVYRGKRVLSV